MLKDGSYGTKISFYGLVTNDARKYSNYFVISKKLLKLRLATVPANHWNEIPKVLFSQYKSEMYLVSLLITYIEINSLEMSYTTLDLVIYLN